MANLKNMIENLAGDAEIVGCVIGDRGWVFGLDHSDHTPKGKLMMWDEASKYLDYEHDTGYGGVDCHAVFAWTERDVIAVGQYDGSTWVYAIPRFPKDIVPTMEGG